MFGGGVSEGKTFWLSGEMGSMEESRGYMWTLCSVYEWKLSSAATRSCTKARAWPAKSRAFSWSQQTHTQTDTKTDGQTDVRGAQHAAIPRINRAWGL